MPCRDQDSGHKTDNTPNIEERRRLQASAAERRIQGQKGRGLKDPEGAKRRAEQRAKASAVSSQPSAASGNGPGLKVRRQAFLQALGVVFSRRMGRCTFLTVQCSANSTSSYRSGRFDLAVLAAARQSMNVRHSDKLMGGHGRTQ